MIWSPFLHNCIKVAVIAPIPEAVTFADSVFSICAKAELKYKLEGEL